MRLISVIARRFSNLAPNANASGGGVPDWTRTAYRDRPELNAQSGTK